ncbi:hypothetical protein G6F35_015644 [Rhizopus arrhizus]|nr:hypothetical protein G6F35_015644 [Rhizopus arrhizus]KAG1254476.1 hypothetical protein G6F68_010832 [Rhizopus microsporus]
MGCAGRDAAVVVRVGRRARRPCGAACPPARRHHRRRRNLVPIPRPARPGLKSDFSAALLRCSISSAGHLAGTLDCHHEFSDRPRRGTRAPARLRLASAGPCLPVCPAPGLARRSPCAGRPRHRHAVARHHHRQPTGQRRAGLAFYGASRAGAGFAARLQPG